MGVGCYETRDGDGGGEGNSRAACFDTEKTGNEYKIGVNELLFYCF